jgi:TonB family protein
MIPRTLVPVDVRPPAPDGVSAVPRRLSSTLDLRTIVPRDLPVKTLDAASDIPDHVPFDVIVGRSIIERTWHVDPRDNGRENNGSRKVETLLDERTVVPAVVSVPTKEDMQKLETLPALTADLLDVVDPDIMTTGDVNLLVGPHEERDAKWNSVSRIFSLVVHIAIIALALASPDLFRGRVTTQADVDAARRQLGMVYLPPSGPSGLQPRPASPNMRITPKVLRKVAPPEIASPPPGPEALTAPTATPSAPSTNPAPPAAHPTDAPTTATQPAAKAPTPGKLNLNIPNMSPGRAVQNSVQNALESGGAGQARGSVGRIPGSGGGSGGGGGGGGGAGTLGNTVTILTPTEGVDFTEYMNRLLASVKRNWYAIIPESARLGDKGMVVIQFKIMKNGEVPQPDPQLTRTSGKEPLDRAAMSAIRASSPFEPLPPAFSGPFIELRFIFLYNLPLEYQ